MTLQSDKRRVLFVAMIMFGLGVAVLLVAVQTTVPPVLFGWTKAPPSPFAQIDRTDICKMTARVDSEDLVGEVTPEFIIPENNYSEIIEYFEPSRLLDETELLEETRLGVLKVYTSNGNLVEIKFYWFGKQGINFTVDDRHFFHGSDLPVCDKGRILGHLLLDLYHESLKAGPKEP